jgi:hypothetical protein
VLDLADPAAPVLATLTETSPYAVALAAAGDRLWVTTGIVGGAAIELFDLVDSLRPEPVGVLPTDHEVINAITAVGHRLYAAVSGDLERGLSVLDYTVPTAPQERAHVPLPGDQTALLVAGATAYTSSARSIQVLDLGDPDRPARVGETWVPATVLGLAAAGDRLHLAASGLGLWILPGQEDPSVPVLDPGDDGEPAVPRATVLRAYPNPFNPAVTLSFTLTRPEPVTLDVYDLAGRRVARLRHGPHAAGPHTVAWRPTDLSSGTYLVRLVTPDRVHTTKLSLIR